MAEKCPKCGAPMEYSVRLEADELAMASSVTLMRERARRRHEMDGTDCLKRQLAQRDSRIVDYDHALRRLEAGPEWSAFENELVQRVGEAREAIRLEYADMVCLAKTRRDEEWGRAEKANERIAELEGELRELPRICREQAEASND